MDELPGFLPPLPLGEGRGEGLFVQAGDTLTLTLSQREREQEGRLVMVAWHDQGSQAGELIVDGRPGDHGAHDKLRDTNLHKGVDTA